MGTQSAGPALFEPQKIFWRAVAWHPEYPKFYTAIDVPRRQHAALQQGQLISLRNSDEQHIVSYLRRSPGEDFLIVVNLSNTPFRGSVEAGGLDWKELEPPLLPHEETTLPFLSLDAFRFRIFRAEAK